MRERRVDVARCDEVALEDVVRAPDHCAAVERLVDGEDGRQRIDVDADPAAGLFEQVPIGMGEEDDGFFRMVDGLAREVGLIVDDQRDDVRAGNVGGRDDDELVPGHARLELDAADDAARRLAPDGDAVQHPRQHQVVDVARLTGDLAAALFAGTDAPIAGMADSKQITCYVLRAGCYVLARATCKVPVPSAAGGATVQRATCDVRCHVRLAQRRTGTWHGHVARRTYPHVAPSTWHVARYWKVLQAFGSPLDMPRRNHSTRCCEVPWVKRSGAMRPLCIRCRRSSPIAAAAFSAFVGVAGFELTPGVAALVGVISPDAGETVGLELQAHRQRILAPGSRRLALPHLAFGTGQCLHVVAELVGEHVGLGKIAARSSLRCISSKNPRSR